MRASAYTRSGLTSFTSRPSPTGVSRALAVFLVAAATLFGSAANAQPPAPVVSASVVGFDRVTLSWRSMISVAPQIQKFQVRYSSTDITGAAWMDITGSDHKTTGHTVTGLAGDTNYTFQVRAVNSDGNGSEALKTQRTLNPALHAPRDFSATGGFRKIDLSWTRATDSTPVERYEYRLSIDNGDNWSPDWTEIPGSSHSTTRHTVTGLADKTTYTVELRSRQGSVRTAAASTTATTDPGPPPPTGFTATGNFRKIDLLWTRASHTAVDAYQYRLSTDGGDNWSPDWTDIPGSGQSTTRHTVTGLDDETTYTVELRIRHGRVRTAAASTTATTNPTPPPTGFTATGGRRKIDLWWTRATHTAVDAYQYRLSTDGGYNWSPDWTDIPGSTHVSIGYTVTGLDETDLADETTYTVELRIRHGTGRSAAARTTVTTVYTGSPSAPTELKVTLSHSCHVDLDWSAPSSNGGKAIEKYEQRKRKGNESFGPWQTDLGDPLATDVTLSPTTSCDHSYTFQVRAVNANGAGPRASITFRPLDDGPPNEPVDLIAVGGIQRVALSWKTPTTLRQIDYYQVRHRNDGHPDNPWTSWTRIPGSDYRTTRHTVTGLEDDNVYIIEVRAVNSKGTGASAQSGRARTQTEPAQAPAGFTATAGIRKVDLAWTAADSTVAVEAYQYRLSTDGGDNWSPDWTDIPDSDGSTTRHTVSRLPNGTAYTVELRIRAGTTHSSAARQSATTPDVPSAPVLSATPAQRSIALTWTTPHAGDRAITGYQYRRTRISPGFTLWTNIPGSGPNTTSYTHTSGLSDVGRRYTFEVRAVNEVGNGRAGSVDGRTAVSGDRTRPTIRTWFAMATEGRHAAVDFSVQLHPPASSTVTVDYRTEDRSATAPADYQSTSGTLTFAPGETEKTLSVPIVDDTVEDSREKFWLLLSNASGALLGVERTYGVIYNHEDVLAGFTLVDAAAGRDVGWLADGTEVTLDAPATGQYGVRAETLPEAAIGSLRLELSGPKAVTRTDNAAPYTLYSGGGGGLPQGAYTLQATAYPDPEGGGAALQTLSVSFTVTAAEASNTAPTGLPEISGAAEVGGTLTASADGIEDADGLDHATFAWQWLANDGARNAEIAGATGSTYDPGPADVGKTIKVRVTFTDDGGTTETATSAPTAAVEAEPATTTALSATFPASPYATKKHKGAGDRPQVVVAFSEAVAGFEKTTPSVTVSEGTVASVQPHTEDGLTNGYIFFLTPYGDEDLQLTLVSDKACDDGGICTSDGTRLSDVPAARTIPGPEKTEAGELSITDASANEGDDTTIDFVVTLDPAGTTAATVDYATADGTATAGDDYTSTSGTLTFDAGTTSKTIPVSIADDTDDESDETFTVTLSNASGADLGTATATGTIRNRTVVVETTPTVSIAGESGKEGDDDEINFTVTLDEAASGTVTVNYATSDGTADAGDDYTAKSGTLSFSAGTTSKTLPVGIEDDIKNESDETFTVTLSNPSGADLGTATATGTIQNRRVEPLTAHFEGMPSEHDGSEFTFELHFSENVEAGYERVRDHAFTLSGDADVNQARRKTQGSNQSWTIRVDPKGNERVSITLPETSNCNDSGGICTHDGRKLSHSTTESVEGPAGISVSDARVQEAAGAVLAFTVTLSRTTGADVTVDYETSDGTAEAGADYTRTSGTLTIGAGSRSAGIDVPVLDDAHDDDDETLTLTLSNPTNAVLDDATATGTIDNNDAMPRALMARFGRTAAVHVIDQIEERIEAPRRPGFDGRIAGRNVDRNIGRDFALGFLRQLGGGTGYGGMTRGRQAMPGRAGQATSATHRMRPHGAGRAPTANATPMDAGRMRPGAGPHQQNGMTGLGLGHRRVLAGSSFAMNRGTKHGGVLSVWSRSAQSRFHGREGLLALNGDVVTSTVGADYAKGRMVSGVAVAHSRGTGGYSGEHSGAVSSAITGVYPWIGYQASERVSVWTVAGYGAGGLLLSPEAGSPIETGLSMAMAAGGGRGRIAGSDRGFALAFKADALWVGTRSDQAHTAGGRLNGTTATVTRLRTALEGAKNVTLSERMRVKTSIETGIRQDGGDAETGAGIDVGAGLALNDAVTGLTVNVQVRTLVVHQAAGFSERGVSVSVSYDPAPASRLGFSARVSPAWGGDAMSGAEGLWSQETMSGMGQHRLLDNSGRRLDTELAYGLPIGARFVGTPRAGVRASEHGRDYRIGYGMQVLQRGKLNLQLGVDAERRESPMLHLEEESAGTDQRVLGRATVQW